MPNDAQPLPQGDQRDGFDDENAEEMEMAQEETSLPQFVSFYLGAECFAFPMAMVQEIIRVPTSVAVPMAPSALIGLANLRGVVLPIVDLRRTLELGPREADDATRVIVIYHGQAIGLVVDRVARVMSIPADQIEPARSVEHTVGSEDLIGVAKLEDGGALVQLVDPAGLLARTFPARVQGGAMLAGGVGNQRSVEEIAEDDTVQLVSVMLDGEEYAFPIEEVDEIVRVPSKFSRVPGTDGHVVGLISLRDRLLPLVCLRRIFNLAGSEMGESNRVVVLRLGGSETSEVRVGVIVDQVREVLRVPSEIREPLPGVLRRGDRHEIGAICQLDQGRRLVSVLSGAALFQLPSLREAIEQVAAEEYDAGRADMDDTTLEEAAMAESDEAQLVIYQLGGQEFGVDIHSVQEIIRIPDNLAHVPRTPDTVKGIINLRGLVLPVVEMRRSFGMSEMARNDRQRILVFNIGGQRTGYIVDSVSEVLRLPQSRMEPAPNLSEAAAKLVNRVANLDGGKRMVLVLDAEPLVREHSQLAAGELDDLTAMVS